VRRPPEPRPIDIWYQLTEDLSDDEQARLLTDLSASERTRHARFAFARDRRDFAAAHALLRRSLSRYADVSPHEWSFVEEPTGKPALSAHAAAPALSFNLSHTHGLVACAIAGGQRIGVDVEVVHRKVDEGVAERFFSDVENAGLRNCATPLERAERFCALWTLKEAYIKAIGQGLSHGLNTIVFEIGESGAIGFTAPPDVDAASWRFGLFTPAEGYRLAVAVEATTVADSPFRCVPG
jgi:4'-phosphopantetheinyl transferase